MSVGEGKLERLARLIQERDAIDREISNLIGRPALLGHVGELIAAAIFEISLEESAAAKGFDGRFACPPLKDCTVNIKWYAKREGVLDLTPACLPDYYLVLAGPASPATSSKGKDRPWLIESVHLFRGKDLCTSLEKSLKHIGRATSVRKSFWNEAEIYPLQTCRLLPLSDDQRRMLSLFRKRELS
jgi:hypothetical protein